MLLDREYLIVNHQSWGRSWRSPRPRRSRQQMWGTSKFSLVDQSGLITMMGQFLTLLRRDQCCKNLERGQGRDHKHSGKTLVCSGFSCWNDKAGNSSNEAGWEGANWEMHSEPYADPCNPDTAKYSLCSGWQSCFPIRHVGERWRSLWQ